MRRLLLLAGLLTCGLLGVLLPAAASWTADVSGTAAVRTTTVNAGNTPAVGVAGDVVSLVWEPSTLASSAPVTGYQVKRYDATGTVAQVVASGSCAQTVAALSCSETAVPNGTWTYSVTPVHHSWKGAESPTATVHVAASLNTAVTFPSVGTSYNLAGFTGGCGTASTGDVCGTVVDSGSGITKVTVSLRQGSGSYWNGTGFTSSDEVLLDATGTTSWSYAFDPAAFPADGRYTLRVRALDGVGVVGEASSAFIVDRTAPVAPTIDSAPPSATSSAAATFEFSNTEARVGFECRLDGSAWSGCGSPRSYSGLADGSHTFEVRSVDAAGNVGTATARSWVVDTVPPSAAITFPASGSFSSDFYAGCGTASTGDVCGTASDAGGSGVAQVQVSLQQGSGSYWNGSGFSSAGEVLLTATGTTSWSHAFSAADFPADGQYTLRARVTDAVGNTATSSSAFTLDRTPPVAPTISSAPLSPSSSAAATFGFSNTEAGLAFECRLDGSAWSGCVSPRSYSGLANGSHTFEVRSVDAAGNISNVKSHTWTVDTVAPSAAITFPAHASFSSDFNAGCGTASTGDVCGTASDAGGSGVDQVQVSLQQGTGSYWNGTGFTSAGEVLLTATGTTSWSHAFSAASFPADGQYTLRARVTDVAGHTTTSSSTFTLDRTPPVAPTIDSAPPSPSSSTTASFGFSNTEAGVGFECRLDGSAWSGCVSPRSYSGLANGSHTFEVRSVDAAGNIGNARTRSWLVDTVAPSAAVTFPVSGSTYGSGASATTTTTTSSTSTYSHFDSGCGTASTGDVCGTASDTGGSGVAQVQVSMQRGTGSYWNGTGFTSSTEVLLTATGTTAWSQAFSAASFPSDGQYTLRARVTDAAGNTTMTATTFAVDATGPRAVDVQTANGTGTAGQIDINGSGDSITFTYSEMVRPGSILTGWDGTTAANVIVKVSEGAARSNDILTVWNATETVQLPLGTINLGGPDYTASEFKYPATMTQNGADIRIVLGARNGKANTAATAPTTMVWTPSTGATDMFGNPSNNTAVTESGAADAEF